MPYLYIAIGFVLLLGGADFLVRGTVAMATRLKISPLLVAMTVVAFGTSAPELVVSVGAALSGAPGIAVGNVVGSNIANILLILGATAIIYPISANRQAFVRDYKALLGATLVFIVFALTEQFERWHGVLMLTLLGLFLYNSYLKAKHNKKELEEQAHEVEELSTFAHKSWIIICSCMFGGLTAIILGAQWLVDGAVDIARMYNVSEEVIGLTLIAFGTSLPELATSAVAAYRKHNDITLGNVIGSNIWNILCIMGATAMTLPVPVAQQVLRIDLWYMFGATLLLFPFMLTQNRLCRLEGSVFLILYVAYIGLQYFLAQNTGVYIPAP